jgi:pantothenate kinase
MSSKENQVAAVPTTYLQRVGRLLTDGQRKLLGLVGAPGAGKSTLARALHQAYPAVSQIVPMDGFHLANSELQRLGRAQRKGAPDTFDSAGYVALLRRLRQQGANETVYAPEFRREIEEPIAGAIAIAPQTQLIIAEGNYLLLDQTTQTLQAPAQDSSHWAAIRGLLDEIWYMEIDDGLRRERLLQRHQQFGRSQGEAAAWVAATDDPNAQLIAATKTRAHLVFRWREP